jgi:hypothetical protein
MHQQPLLAPHLPNRFSSAGLTSGVTGRIVSFIPLSLSYRVALFVDLRLGLSNIYARSQRADERVMAGIEKLLAKRLKSAFLPFQPPLRCQRQHTARYRHHPELFAVVRHKRYSVANFRFGSWSFSNSGPRIKLSVNILAGSRVLSAIGACPPHDGVRRRWWINVARAVSPIESSQKIWRSHHRHRPGRDMFFRRAAGTL